MYSWIGKDLIVHKPVHGAYLVGEVGAQVLQNGDGYIIFCLSDYITSHFTLCVYVILIIPYYTISASTMFFNHVVDIGYLQDEPLSFTLGSWSICM